MTRPKRKRRTPEEAREEILVAAEDIILHQGPAELKFQSLADRAGLAVSNVYHHFGGVLEIKRALADRVLGELATDLAASLAEEADKEPLDYAQNVLRRVYAILRTERYSKLMGWIVLSTELGELEDFIAPLPAMKALVAAQMAQHLSTAMADRLADAITYNVSITAIGEGLVGPAVRTALSLEDGVADGSVWLSQQWNRLLMDALSERAETDEK